MKKPKIKLIPFKNIKTEWMKDPAFKKAYDDLDFEFQLIEALIKARARKNLTQKELAEKIGIAQSALARFESGGANPTLSFLKKVTEGLGMKLIAK
ncbi:MAG: helix-turn-helix transcriptional regulator [Candidatus Paceibacterota bacterium]